MNSVNAASHAFTTIHLTYPSTISILDLLFLVIITNFLFLTFVTFCPVFGQFYCLFVLHSTTTKTIFKARIAFLHMCSLGQIIYSIYTSIFLLLFVNIPVATPSPKASFALLTNT